MKVLQFITRLDVGGAQEVCLELCSELWRRGHSVHLLTAAQKELLPEARRLPHATLHLWHDWLHQIRL